MSLTGLPLLLLVAAAAVAAAAATARTWRHHRRWTHLTRAAAVLLTETLALVAAGLAVNRTAQFYPTWADLLPADTIHRDTGPARPGHLDHVITSRAGRTAGGPVSFTWHPPRWTSWPVTAAPTVVVPADYPQHPTWRYPVIILAAPANPAHETSAAHTAEDRAGPAVIVLTHLRPAATPDILTETLPTSLTRDLRVTTHNWALVAGDQLTPLARAAVHAAPTRYPTLALIGDNPNQPATPAPTDLPATETVAVAGIPTRPGDPATHLDTPPAEQLTAALTWACQQTPPPLSAPTQLIPPPSRRPHHHHHNPPTGG
ncbi:hypothetical protein ACNAW0_21510 [Micromonospora sp. SL1-18]|uniref:hypothetical protein n=1 Tax=Micromonospora sp. SL1-18 TaxID=3399128 RepID=UPI003A4E0740